MTKKAADLQAILPKLASIGIAFSSPLPKEAADIEQTIIDVLPVLREDLKLLTLLITWGMEMGDLVHVERLKALMKNLAPVDLAFIGAIAEYLRTRFRNWALISSQARKGLPSNFSYKLPEKITLSVEYDICQSEPSFAKFGLMVPEIKLADRKKLIPRKYLVEDNSRFRFRAFFGTNWRADIAHLMSKDNKANAFQISKTLQCSYETAYRIKKNIDESKVQMNLLEHTHALKAI